jgi:hypothetical protein
MHAMSRTPLSKNPYVRARVKAAKTADKDSRLTAKRQGVKFINDKVVKHLNGKRGLAGSDDSRQARASRTPSLGLPRKGVLLAKTPSTYVGRLSTVADWHRQIGKVYREMRRHQIDPSLGTKLSYVANVGATLARFIEETMPKGIDIPPDYSRLSDAELQQLEYLLAKAAGPKAQERITQSTAGATYEN